MSGGKWLVGRQETCYVEEAEPLVIAGVDCGEQVFDTEAEALVFAIECDATIRDNLSRNLVGLRARLRRARAQQEPSA